MHSKAVLMPGIIAAPWCPQIIYSIIYIYIQGGESQFWNLRIHTYVHNHGNDNRGNKRRWHHIQAKANTLCETKQNQRYLPIKITQPRRPIRTPLRGEEQKPEWAGLGQWRTSSALTHNSALKDSFYIPVKVYDWTTHAFMASLKKQRTHCSSHYNRKMNHPRLCAYLFAHEQRCF